jgi:hypothetical protein
MLGASMDPSQPVLLVLQYSEVCALHHHRQKQGAEQPMRRQHSHWRTIHRFTTAIHGHHQSPHT